MIRPTTILWIVVCLSGSLTYVPFVYLLVLLNCPFNITPYKFVPRIPVLLSSNTPPSPWVLPSRPGMRLGIALTMMTRLLIPFCWPPPSTRQEAAPLRTKVKLSRLSKIPLLPLLNPPLLTLIKIPIKLPPLIKIPQQLLLTLRMNYHPPSKPVAKSFTKNTAAQ